MFVTAIITAGGKGKRMGEECPKQFLPLGNKPLLTHAVASFQACPQITEIILVVPANTIITCQKEIVEDNCFSKVKKIVAGGKERTDSVYNGLLNASKDTDYILIHDGVRPFVRETLILRVLEAAIQYGSAVPGLPPKETVKTTTAEAFVLETLERSKLLSIQTPQAFRYNLLISAYERFYLSGGVLTDDSQIVEKSGYQVKVVSGQEDNLKITTPLDLALAEVFWQRKC